MQNIQPNSRLLSHQVTAPDLAITVNNIKARIIKAGDLPHVSVKRQLQILNELTAFDFGKFLLQHQGANGFWTHYFLTHPWHGRKTGLNNAQQPFTTLEGFILDQAPLMLATQERFLHFLAENQLMVKNGAALACIPCGMMGELLCLNYAGISNIRLVGIDLDTQAINDAKILTQRNNLLHWTEFMQKDAWHLDLKNEFNLISSNGLNIYEPDDDKVFALYESFYHALVPHGTLVTSFLTYPPNFPELCEWEMQKINPADSLLQRIIFGDVLNAKFQCYRTTTTTKEQLNKIGFKEIKFIYDRAKIFPTVVAKK